MTVVGELALWIALFLTVWGCAASFAGPAMRRPELIESAVRASFATVPMLVLAVVGLLSALLRHDFSLEYVTAHTTTNTPKPYLMTALWGGPEGSLLSWALAVSICVAAAVSATRRRDPPALPRLAGTLAAVLALTLAAICFAANPYDRVEWVPAEGRGLAPHFQSPLAAPHFVALYAGYAAATIPLAATVAVINRKSYAQWLLLVQRWSLLAWCLLTVGIALGMRWAYVEPALGGGWTWDAARFASLVLWLVSAAVARSVVARGWDERPARAPVRRRRVPGMYAMYAGVVFILVGVGARRVWTEQTVRLRAGEGVELRGPYGQRWRLVSQGVSRDEQENYLSTAVAVEAWRGADRVGIISPERRQYFDGAQRTTSDPVLVPGIRSSIALDVYVLLAEARGEVAELRVGFRPLASSVWLGWTLVLAGALATAAQAAIREADGDSRSAGAAG